MERLTTRAESARPMNLGEPVKSPAPGGLAFPFVAAAAQVALQVFFHGNYGYFRDELYYIACSNHLAFGYVDQPPLSIAILWLNRMLLGDSLQALRILPSLASAGVVLLTAVMARDLGGSRWAQGLAALSVVCAPGLLGQSRFFSMNPFDVLFWALALAILVRIFRGEHPRWWLLFGLATGLGLQNKYSIGFMVLGLVAALLITPQRKHLAGKWFWLGAAVAAVIFLPHILWEAANRFPSLEFMRNASLQKNVRLGVIDFFMGQFLEMNIVNAAIWLCGLLSLFVLQGGRYRPLAWMYPIICIIMLAGSAKVYYLFPVYPVLLAAGAVWIDDRARQRNLSRLKIVPAALLVIFALVTLPFALPVLPVDEFIRYEHLLGLAPHSEERIAVGELPQYYADQFGWREMADTVARVYGTLTPQEQSRCVIYMRNYGEAAAIDFFGKKLGLPGALCAHNSYWHWGPGERTGDVAIIVGSRRTLQENLDDLRRAYGDVTLAAVTRAEYSMPYENGRMIFVCRGMNTTFQAIWPAERFYI